MYLTALNIIIIMLFPIIAIGRFIIKYNPIIQSHKSEIYIAPVLGLSAILLISSWFGWLHQFNHNTSIVIILSITGISLIKNRDFSTFLYQWWLLSLFAIVSTLPLLLPLLLYNTFNPMNDGFTYLVHSQWLQQHSFLEEVNVSGNFPALSQIQLYKSFGSRMGASFFLSLVQSFFNNYWSYDAYMGVTALVFSIGCLTLGILIKYLVAINDFDCLFLCLIPAYSMNGFLTGAQLNFFPQTFGLTFSLALVALIPTAIYYVRDHNHGTFKYAFILFPPSLVAASLVVSYNDMLPAFLAGLIPFLIYIVYKKIIEIRKLVIALTILSVEVIVLSNIEIYRMVLNYFSILMSVSTGQARLGWPVLWNPMQFLSFSFGMKLPHFIMPIYYDQFISNYLAPILIGLISITVVKSEFKKRVALIFPVILSINLVYAAAFIKFRYFTSSGLDYEVGYTFAQWKLSKWISLINLSLVAVALSELMQSSKKSRFVIISIISIVYIYNFHMQMRVVSPLIVQEFQSETGVVNSSFEVFKGIRERVSSISPDDVIYLEFPGHTKLRQFMTYILYDRKLASNYEDDGYFAYVPQKDQVMPLSESEWLIDLDRNLKKGENELNISGIFHLSKRPF
jgi:hypothetical protein